MPESEARKKWIKENTTFVGMRLQNRTDADILSALEGKQNQTEIKRLIRIGLRYDTAAENAAYSRGFLCSCCGAEETDPEEYDYCPKCGKRIVR